RQLVSASASARTASRRRRWRRATLRVGRSAHWQGWAAVSCPCRCGCIATAILLSPCGFPREPVLRPARARIPVASTFASFQLHYLVVDPGERIGIAAREALKGLRLLERLCPARSDRVQNSEHGYFRRWPVARVVEPGPELVERFLICNHDRSSAAATSARIAASQSGNSPSCIRPTRARKLPYWRGRS